MHSRRHSHSKTLFATLLGLALVLFSVPAQAAIQKISAASDEQIRFAVSDRLILDHGVNAKDIELRVDDGVVTMSGQVDTLLSKRRATEIAETIRGVRGVVNDIVVDTRRRLDRRIAEDIRAALLINPATEAFAIDVTVANGVATLNGEVNSFTELELAEKIATSIRGVVAVENEVTFVFDAQRSDDEIRNDVRSALRWDAYVNDALLEVTVDNQRVDLSGTVGSLAERRNAIGDAWVDGVLAVDAGAVQVEPWADNSMQRDSSLVSQSDDSIRQAVLNALDSDPRLSAERIDVRVASNAVTLRGKVDSLDAKRAARQDAINTVGVRRVRNFLIVDPTNQPSDVELIRNAREALTADAYVSHYEIVLAATKGEINMTGAVDSRFEKARAEAVVARVNGVVDIHNDLRVIDPSSAVSGAPIYDWSAFDYEWNEYANVRTKSDRSIVEDIYTELTWSPFVDADQIVVTVEDGVATLVGEVDSWTERRAAATNALQGGAIRVINRIDIAGEQPASAAMTSGR